MRVGISALMRVETWALMRAGTLSKTLTSWDIVNDIDESLDIVNDKIWEIAIDERWEGWGQSH